MDKAKQNSMVMMISGVAIALGSFLAWVTVAGFSASGTSEGGDGWITLVAGLAVAAFGYAKFSGAFKLPVWVGWAGVVIALVVAVMNILDVMDFDGAGVGIGLWLILLGGAAGIYGLIQSR